MNDVKELKEEDLKQVSGGDTIINHCPCDYFNARPGRGGQNSAVPNTWICEDCTNWQLPEGPCKKGFGKLCTGQHG